MSITIQFSSLGYCLKGMAGKGLNMQRTKVMSGS